MCGIAGIVNYQKQTPVDRALLHRMAASLIHRGPDDEGYFAEGYVGFAFRRLAILDLSPTGHQPMATTDGSVWIIFNGEIYNFRELHEDLQRHGYKFRGTSDTEVLVNAYHFYGETFLQKLNGMFAIALWDIDKQRLMLARDRMGKKPLYVADNGERVVFASEMKAIFQVPDFTADIDVQAIDEYFAFGYVSGERTIYGNVKQILPGSFAHFEPGSKKSAAYYHIKASATTPSSEGEAIEQVSVLLEDAVRIRMVSEVPLGAYLSGGIDSSLVVSTMARLSSLPVKTFSIGFPDAEFDETADARVVAKYLGTEHHEEIVTPDYASLMHDILSDFDQPFGDSSALPTYVVSKLTRQHITVALTGDGGDEVFGGYALYDIGLRERKLDRIPRVMKSLLRSASNVYPDYLRGGNLLRRASLLGFAERYVDRFQLMNEKERGQVLLQSFRGELSQSEVLRNRASLFPDLEEEDPLRSMQYFDMLSYLPDDILAKVDRMSMLNSLETRSPFLDYRLVEFGLGLPQRLKYRNGSGKFLLRRLTASTLPAEVANRPKRGFSVPLRRWFRNELKSYVHDVIFSQAMRESGMINMDYASRVFAIHQAGLRDMSVPLWLLVAFAVWLETSTSWRIWSPREGTR